MAEERSAWVELRRRLDDGLGREAAMTLKDSLPGQEVATKSDINALEDRFGLKLEALEHKLTGALHERVSGVLEQIGAVSSDISMQTRLMVVALVGTVATVAALAFSPAGLR